MRIAGVISAGWIASSIISGWALNPPAAPLLDNLDKRLAPAARAAAVSPAPPAATAFTAAQREAASRLQQRVGALTVEADRLLGSPRNISSTDGFLTGPGGRGGAVSDAFIDAVPSNDPHRVIKAFLNEHAALFGHDAEALSSARITRDYTTGHNGLRTVVWEQTLAGIPVFDSVIQGHLTRQNELVRVSSRWVPNAQQAAANVRADWSSLTANPPISAAVAVSKAAADVGDQVDAAAMKAMTEPEELARKQQFRGPLLKGDTYVQLMWLPMSRDSLRLCWRVILVSKARNQMFLSLVDAQTGEVLVRRNQTRYQATNAIPTTLRVWTSDSPSPFTPGWDYPNSAQPPVVARTLLTNVVGLPPYASSRGWVDPADINGQYSTKGNNVDAHTDLDDDDVPDLPRPISTDNPPIFDFPADLTTTPLLSTNASVVSLFYWNNFGHDKFYELGFVEAAGSYQNNNFGRGGLGQDAVLADGLDGAVLNDMMHVNNANFQPTPDGLPGRMQMYLFDGPNPDRDADYDAEIILHEYTHGVSDRVVGGGAGLLYSGQTGGQSEGYSDFFGMTFLHQASDNPGGCYPTGGYCTYLMYDLTENYYYGIRRYPYSTDLTKNPLTFKDVDPTQADPHAQVPMNPIISPYIPPEEVHMQGEVWCVALWEVWANLAEALGVDEGTRVALQLVYDGMRLCPVDPTYLDARDAILQADTVAFGSANRAEIWRGFAKRGFGYSAQAPAFDTTIGVREAYDLPDDVIVYPPDGILELFVNPVTDSTLYGGSNTPIFVRVRDGIGVTNATVRCKINGVTDLTFNNTGQVPDARARDSIYTASLAVPAMGTNLTLNLSVSAPGKTNATMAVTYYIATVPVNDFFSAAIKTKAPGEAFLSNNKFATLEFGEPVHAGVTNMGASLWWDWTPTNSGKALIDTAGSAFRSLLAVYTGNSLLNLKQVGAVSSVPQRQQAYLFLDVQKGVTYHIAVASVNTNNAGMMRLRIELGGQPDITPPTVNILKPLSGRVFTNNVVDVLASAVDPEPVPSGVDKFLFYVGPRNLDGVQTVAAIGGAQAGTTTNTVRLALTKGRNTITVKATDVAGNTSPGVSVMVTYRPQDPPNDHFAYALPLLGTSGTRTGNNALATKEPGEPQHANNPGGHSVWWKWQAPADGSLLFSTEGSSFDTVMGIYTGTRVDALTTIAFNDDAYEGAKFSKARHAVRAKQTYAVAVDGFGGATGSVQLAYSFLATNIFSVNLGQTAGGTTLPGAGVFDVEAGSTLSLAAFPDAYHEFVGWEGDLASTQNPAIVRATRNLNIRAVFQPRTYSDDFESGGLTTLNWSTGGNSGWVVAPAAEALPQSNVDPAVLGKSVARSGRIGHSQSSSLLLTARFRPELARFQFRVSSEPEWDALQFYVDGKLQQQWSGDMDWTTYEFPLTVGQHTLEWRYVKDSANNMGLDAAFIDNLSLPLEVPVGPASAGRLSLTQLPGGSVQVLVRGQTNQVYVIQATSGFPPQWQSVYTNVARYGEVRFTDSDAAARPQRFYRAVAR